MPPVDNQDGARTPAALAALGLTGAEEAAYELLVARPAATLPQLLAGWTRVEDLADVLRALAGRGIVLRTDAPERFEAVDPDVAVEPLLVAAEQRLEAAREEARRLAALHREHVLGPDRNVVELIRGGEPLRQRVAQVKRAARRQLRCLSPFRPAHRTADDTDLEVLARRVAGRTIYDRAAVERPGALAGAERVAAAGGETRVLPQVPLEMYLADDRLALLPLATSGQDHTGLVIHPSGLLDALGDLFEGLWQRALPLGLATGPASSAAEPLAEPERQRITALLLSGLTDQAIARQLGVSYRTVQRRIASLMDELNASTRFQAGVQAAIRAGRQAGGGSNFS
jgi:sugar-specific transcriptional regulator TrmB/DNA-binding CsgD family transcriptional regulator